MFDRQTDNSYKILNSLASIRTRNFKFRSGVRQEKSSSRFTLHHSLGFTLAEVLITLGIIGVVAAMTIPTLLNNASDSANINAWKKAYTTLAQAYYQMASEEPVTWASHTDMKNQFEQYFKVITSCPTAGSTCWHSAGIVKTKPLNDGTQYPMSDKSIYPGIITADGMEIIFQEDVTDNDPYTTGWAMIDVNGIKPPNTAGKDIFGLRFGTSGAKTYPFTETEMGTCSPPAAGTAGNGYIGLGCSEYYVLGGK